MENVIGYVHQRETFGAVDGPGVRYVLFLQGCPLHCLYCHNPDSMPALGPQLQMRIYPNNIDNLTNTKIRKFGVIYRIS